METQHRLIQQDNPVRLLALKNLRIMCEHASGVCHRYWIEKVTRSRVHIGYSNPDEYAHESPMFAVLPCFPSGDGDNPSVVVDVMRVLHDTDGGEGWQHFGLLLSQYATRSGSGVWCVVPCDSMMAAAKASMIAQHHAYHKSFDDGRLCVLCSPYVSGDDIELTQEDAEQLQREREIDDLQARINDLRAAETAT